MLDHEKSTSPRHRSGEPDRFGDEEMKKESIFEQKKSTRGRHCLGQADRFGDEKVDHRVALFDFACLLLVAK